MRCSKTQNRWKKKGVLKFEDGKLGKHVEGEEMHIKFNGEDSGCYPDDVIGVIRDVLCSFENPDKYTVEAISLLQKAIEVLDKRAVEKHGYSWSENEKNYTPPYLKE